MRGLKLATKLIELTEGKKTTKKHQIKLIEWLQKKEILRGKVKCSRCHDKMKLKKKIASVDRFEWRCQRRNCKRKKSIRHKSIFTRSKVSLFNWMKFVYRSSRTLSRMAKQLREVCVTAMERLRQREGQRIGGRRHFVVIDESHFRHKRKYGRGRMAGGWKRRKWVFGMLGVQSTQMQPGRRQPGQRPRGPRRRSGKPVLRLVEKRGRRELVPLIAHHVKRGSCVISDEWRAYRNALPQHFTL
ncbi:uncharacterized protein LOC115579957 isoform X2 [Sparus aurata]|uniref:uncharacterized protein LOC115579957 isoform X2 n=1 Tax=Sparus aurata TaxID=8175 RepID=UPI0011C1B023|nr:uncharacterized protein LOC115579957 isoform X2 [Sparus aurata]